MRANIRHVVRLSLFRVAIGVTVWSGLLTVSCVGLIAGEAEGGTVDGRQTLQTDGQGSDQQKARGTGSLGPQRACRTAPCHPLTVEESLSLARPSSIQISPDGNLVAYVVTRMVRERYAYRAVLYVGSARSPGREKALGEGKRILNVQWFPDSSAISYILETDSGTQVWRIKIDGSHREQLTHTSVTLVRLWETDFADTYSAYALSPDGAHIIYAVYGAESEQCPNPANGGVIYRGEGIAGFLNSPDCPVAVELWKLDIESGATDKIWTSPAVEGRDSAIPPEFRWSPDGKKVAVSYLDEASALSKSSIALVDPFKGTSEVLLANLGGATSLDWTDDGGSLRFYSMGSLSGGSKRNDAAWYRYRVPANKLEKYPNEASWAVGPAADTVTKIMEAVEKESGDFLANCSLNLQRTRAACMREAPMTPPEVVSLDLDNGIPQGRPLLLTTLNPQYDSIALGEVSRLTWPNRGGKGSAGLILPVGYAPGKKYPLIVMLYNLYSGKQFISSVPAFPNYPAQAFAGKGYIVLLMNIPSGTFTYAPGNFKEAKAAEVDEVVDDITAAIELLSQRGLVDRERMGIMGWSYGAFWTDYIVTHFPTWFQAAASGEGDNHNPSLYWQGDDAWRDQERMFFGCGPYRGCYDRWKEVAPVLNVGRLKVPLLMEYSSAYLNGIEMYTAIAEQHGLAELVIYPGEEHVFSKPLNRYSSMARHFDWFNFWLLGEEDPSPTKADQYVRWRQMRKALESKNRH